MNVSQTEYPTAALEALQAAENAARKAAVSVRPLQERADIDAASKLFSRIWDADGNNHVMPKPVLTALVHSTNYVSGAFADGELIGTSVGFLGQRDARVVLHSHITGVTGAFQGRGVGFALKQHQRAWALQQGLETVTWTFDPLVRRNGYFNITKLGAEIVDYRANFYGAMEDGINRDDDTDRCVVAWRLTSPRAVEAAEGRNPTSVEKPGATTLLADVDGEPEVRRARGSTLLVFIPEDIVLLRQQDPDAAARWRLALREALQWALPRSYTVTGMTRAGCYVLSR